VNRRILIVISLALVITIAGVSYLFLPIADDANSPGSVDAIPVNETEVGNREVIDYKNETIQEMDTLRASIRAAHKENGSVGFPIRGTDSQREAELLRSLAKYEPITRGSLSDFPGVFYVRYEGQVYEIYPNVRTDKSGLW